MFNLKILMTIKRIKIIIIICNYVKIENIFDFFQL